MGMMVNLVIGGLKDRGGIQEFLDDLVSQDKMVILGYLDCLEDFGVVLKFVVVLVRFNCIICYCK